MRRVAGSRIFWFYQSSTAKIMYVSWTAYLLTYLWTGHSWLATYEKQHSFQDYYRCACGVWDGSPRTDGLPETQRLGQQSRGRSGVYSAIYQAWWGSAIQAAAYYEGEEVVHALLDASAQVNAQGGYHGNALQAAARYRWVCLVQMLLNAGIDSNTRGGIYRDTLTAATR